ncbi:MAG: S1 RNA-binding domain-containing protein [Nitrospinae bacterium]|nr:S1 RNA-binding domain-containing protein [Nitrospinota bacterium]
MGVIKRVTREDFVDAAVAAGQEAAERSSEFATMLDEVGESYKEGALVIGTVVAKTNDAVVIDVGFKSEGTVPLHEFGAQAATIKVGDEVEVLLEAMEDNDGALVLSKDRANKIRVWDKMAEKFDADETVEGIVLNKIKGGLSVDIGLKAFLPGSQVDLRPIKYLEKLIGEKLNFKIIKMNKKRGNIVLSRRVLLEQERKVSKEQALATLQEGKIVDGIVKNITDYGAFIDLGGIDGLLHITDMSWGRVNHPSEMFGIGDNVKVMVLKFDRDTERVSLGLKQTTPDPWVNAASAFPPATRVTGRVVSIADYGAFVELQEGIEGLVHISEMTWNKNIRHPNKLVAVGDNVEAVVLSIR